MNIDEIEKGALSSFVGQEVYFSGLQRNDSFITLYLQLKELNLSWANKPLSKKLPEKEPKVSVKNQKLLKTLSLKKEKCCWKFE